MGGGPEVQTLKDKEQRNAGTKGYTIIMVSVIQSTRLPNSV